VDRRQPYGRRSAPRRERIPARKLLVIPNGFETPAEVRLAARAAKRDFGLRLEIPKTPPGRVLLVAYSAR
jgi:hypothetical protein